MSRNYDSYLDARHLKDNGSETVFLVKNSMLQSIITNADVAIGHHAVHVENDHLNLLRLFSSFFDTHNRPL